MLIPCMAGTDEFHFPQKKANVLPVLKSYKSQSIDIKWRNKKMFRILK